MLQCPVNTSFHKAFFIFCRSALSQPSMYNPASVRPASQTVSKLISATGPQPSAIRFCKFDFSPTAAILFNGHYNTRQNY